MYHGKVMDEDRVVGSWTATETDKTPPSRDMVVYEIVYNYHQFGVTRREFYSVGPVDLAINLAFHTFAMAHINYAGAQEEYQRKTGQLTRRET